MDISVIICTYNRCDRLASVLDCLERMATRPGLTWEVLVVDNRSSDRTKAVVQEYIDRKPGTFRYVFEGRQGKSFALNTAIREAKADVLAFTDDDVTIDPNWVTVLDETFANRDCAAMAGKIIPVWTAKQPEWFREEGDIRFMAAIVQYDLGDSPLPVIAPPFGANMAFRRGMFEKYGVFREDLGPNTKDMIRGEDSEFCSRLIAGKENFVYIPTAIVHHPVEQERTSRAYFQNWYFDYGRASVRREGRSPNALPFLGFPKYLVRMALTSALKWQVSIRPNARFYHKLNLYRVAGEMRESWSQAKRARLHRSI